MNEVFTSPMPPSIKDYTQEIINGLIELTQAYAKPENVGEYMGICHAIKYIEDGSRKYR